MVGKIRGLKKVVKLEVLGKIFVWMDYSTAYVGFEQKDFSLMFYKKVWVSLYFKIGTV